MLSRLALVGFGIASLVSLASAQVVSPGPGKVKGIRKISHTQGGRVWPLDDEDQLGRSVALMGDLDGNGIVDLAAAGHADDDGGIDQGAAYVYFLRSDGQVLRTQKISELEGGFTGVLDVGDQFGRALSALGDLDGDGVMDLTVGANYDDDGGVNKGALYLMLLNRDGTVKRTTKISQTQGGFTALLRNNDEFGRSVAPLGDLDGDGDPDVIVGAPTDSTGGIKRGALYVLFLRPDGTVERHTKIASGMGGFTGRLRNTDWFGFSLANIGDFDGDGVVDVAVGTALDDDGAVNAGAVWLLYLRRDGTVKDWRKISMLSGGFTGVLEQPDQFGTGVIAVGDVNGDGVTELAVGAVKDGDGGRERGAVYVLFMTPQGTVAFHQKISDLEGDFPPRTLNHWDWLGSALAPLGDFDGDGVNDIVIGARNDDDGGPNRGALYITYLRGPTTALSAADAAGLWARGSDVVDLRDEPASAGDLAAATDEPAASVTFGVGPEPEGSLALVEGSGRAGTSLTFRLPVPAELAGGVARLIVARQRSEDVAAIERMGLILDPATVLGTLEAVAPPTLAEVEITVELPAGLSGATLVFQGVWTGGGGHRFTDAVELTVR